MADFDEFWARYPRKVGKFDAQRKYVIARKNATHGEIMNGLELYLQHLPKDPAFIVHAKTFLHQGRWLDEYEDAQLVKKLQAVNLRLVNPADWERDPTWDKKRDCPHGGKYGGYCETRGLCQRTEKQEQSA